MELTEEEKKLLEEEKVLTLRLRAIKERTALIRERIIEEMKTAGVKTQRVGKLEFVHSPVKDRETFYNTKMALKYLKEHRPDLVTVKKGYDRLIIKLVSE